MTTAEEFLGVRTRGANGWSFELGPHLYGAFGGVFGGAVAAACLQVSRSCAGGRTPVALDCRFVRGLRAGMARAVPTVVHEGRSLTCVSIDLFDEAGNAATRATVSLVASEVLAATSDDGAPVVETPAEGAAWQLPPGVEAPIIATLAPFFAGSDEQSVTTAIHLPWDEPSVSPEAICLATDLCVGPPVARALPDPRTPHPNPDISLRFARGPTSSTIAAEGTLARTADGVALVAIRAWAAGCLVATGTSTSLLLRN